MYSATVQSQLHEPCSVYYFATEKFRAVLCPLASDPSDARVPQHVTLAPSLPVFRKDQPSLTLIPMCDSFHNLLSS